VVPPSASLNGSFWAVSLSVIELASVDEQGRDGDHRHGLLAGGELTEGVASPVQCSFEIEVHQRVTSACS
jgi:hypothetical protein